MGLVIKINLTVEGQGDVRSMTSDMSVASRVGITTRFATSFHAVEKIANVERCRIATNLIDFAALQ